MKTKDIRPPYHALERRLKIVTCAAVVLAVLWIWTCARLARERMENRAVREAQGLEDPADVKLAAVRRLWNGNW